MYQTLFLFLKIVSKSQIFTNTITTTEGRLPCCTIIKQMHRGKRSRRAVWNISNMFWYTAEERTPTPRWHACDFTVMYTDSEKSEKQTERWKTGGKRRERRSNLHPRGQPPTSLKNLSVVLFQECSDGQWLPLAETCEDSARSGPGGDLQFYSTVHTERQQTKVVHFETLFTEASQTRSYVTYLMSHRLTCWWTAPGQIAALRWRSSQKGPHLHGMAAVS